MQLNENHKMIRQMARDFASAKLAPIAAEIDRTAEVPEATVREMGQLGFLGLTTPEEYGGVGADLTSYALVVEEISRVCGSHGLTVAAHNSLGCWPIATCCSSLTTPLPRPGHNVLWSMAPTSWCTRQPST